MRLACANVDSSMGMWSSMECGPVWNVVQYTVCECVYCIAPNV